MTDITVVRGNGDWPGSDITDPLLTTDAVALARGISELEEGTPAQQWTLTLPPTVAQLGQTVRVQDRGITVQGKLTAIRHAWAIDDQGHLSGETELTVRVPNAPA